MGSSNQPMRYRKKPIEIEAMQLRAYTELLPPADYNSAGGDIWRWMDGHDVEIRCEQEDPGPAYGVIPTLEGDMRADIGDWIIRGIAGEFYPCKPSIFEATYEPVTINPNEPHRYTVDVVLHGAEPYPCVICGRPRQATFHQFDDVLNEIA